MCLFTMFTHPFVTIVAPVSDTPLLTQIAQLSRSLVLLPLSSSWPEARQVLCGFSEGVEEDTESEVGLHVSCHRFFAAFRTLDGLGVRDFMDAAFAERVLTWQ